MDKANILLRVSTEQQEEKNQEQECRDYCEKNNIEINKIFYEKGSAFSKSFEERETWQACLNSAIQDKCNIILVWNMDRYSRLPPEKVLDYTKKLALFNNIQIRAVHGDTWADLIETISKIKEMGFIGQALTEFLEKIIKGLEHQRAYTESKTKSERIRLAVRKKGNTTVSYKGNKWGRKALPKQTIDRILHIKKYRPDLSIRGIIATGMAYYYDKNGNKKTLSKSTVHKILQEFYYKKNP